MPGVTLPQSFILLSGETINQLNQLYCPDNALQPSENQFFKLAEFAKHEDLMVMLREDLWQALLQAVRTLQLGALAGAGQVALSLWLHLGSQLLLQLEALLQIILQRLAQGSRLSASQHQEAALEVRSPRHTHSSTSTQDLLELAAGPLMLRLSSCGPHEE